MAPKIPWAKYRLSCTVYCVAVSLIVQAGTLRFINGKFNAAGGETPRKAPNFNWLLNYNRNKNVIFSYIGDTAGRLNGILKSKCGAVDTTLLYINQVYMKNVCCMLRKKEHLAKTALAKKQDQLKFVLVYLAYINTVYQAREAI